MVTEFSTKFDSQSAFWKKRPTSMTVISFGWSRWSMVAAQVHLPRYTLSRHWNFVQSVRVAELQKRSAWKIEGWFLKAQINMCIYVYRIRNIYIYCIYNVVTRDQKAPMRCSIRGVSNFLVGNLLKPVHDAQLSAWHISPEIVRSHNLGCVTSRIKRIKGFFSEFQAARLEKVSSEFLWEI